MVSTYDRSAALSFSVHVQVSSPDVLKTDSMLMNGIMKHGPSGPNKGLGLGFAQD